MIKAEDCCTIINSPSKADEINQSDYIFTLNDRKVQNLEPKFNIIKDPRRILYTQIRQSQINRIKQRIRLSTFLQQQIFNQMNKKICYKNIFSSQKPSQMIEFLQSEQIAKHFTSQILYSVLINIKISIRCQASLVLANYLCFYSAQAVLAVIKLQILPILLIAMRENRKKATYIEMAVELLIKILAKRREQQIFIKYLHQIQQTICLLLSLDEFNLHIKIKALVILKQCNILSFRSQKFIRFILNLRLKIPHLCYLLIQCVLTQINNIKNDYDLQLFELCLWSLSITYNQPAELVRKNIFNSLTVNFISLKNKIVSQESLKLLINCLINEINNGNVHYFNLLIKSIRQLNLTTHKDLWNIIGQTKIQQIITGIQQHTRNKSFMNLQFLSSIVDLLEANSEKYKEKLQKCRLQAILQIYQKNNKEAKLLHLKANKLLKKVFQYKQAQ